MTSSDMLSINNVAAKLGLSVHQLRRWELMFGLEIKRGRGQQRQYREEDMSVLERIKELVEQGWPTSQIRPQLEAEGLLSPKLIGAPPAPGNPEVLQEAIIGLRNFSERRFIDLSKQIDELRQLLISVTLKQELSSDRTSPWQPMASEYVPAPKTLPPQEITIGPQISIDPPKASPISPPMGVQPARVNQIPPPLPTSSPASPYSPSQSGSGGSSSEFSQRSMIGGGGGGSPTPSTTNAPAAPGADEAARPMGDALQRSMSTLDGLFKDSRNTPGVGTDDGSSSPQTSSTTSSSSLPSSAGSSPVRYSTIPPTPSYSSAGSPGSPTAQTPSTTSSSQIPPVNPATASTASGGNLPAATTISTTSASQTPAVSPTSPATISGSNITPPPSPNPAYGATRPAGFGGVSTDSAPATPARPTESSPSTPSTGSTPSAWDQAFTKTSVDIDAAPSGLFEGSSGSAPASAPTPERNPFTSTGTNSGTVEGKPIDASPALMGQTPGGGPGFGGSSQSGPNMSLTGPLPAHTPLESFAPEQKDKLISSQSDSTSTDLPRSEEPESKAEAEPAPIPALPITAGPQVNFGPSVSAPTPQVTPQRVDDNFGLGEVTDQNYLTVLGRALDLIGWSDEQADSFSLKTFGVPHWDELGRSQAEKLVAHLVGLLKDQLAQ